VLLQKSETQIGTFQQVTAQGFHPDDSEILPYCQGERVSAGSFSIKLKGNWRI
jgi:hypothetical protein